MGLLGFGSITNLGTVDRDPPVERDLAGPVHDAYTPGADVFLDLEVAKARACCNFPVGRWGL